MVGYEVVNMEIWNGRLLRKYRMAGYQKLGKESVNRMNMAL